MIAFSSNVNSSVLINEILANGLNDPDSEWIELFNNESTAINLTNWNLSESSSSNFTLSTTIPANSFIILSGDFKTFNSTYPNVDASGIKIINITISNFNLADTSGEVRLYNSSGALVDSIAYVQASGKTFENVSIGRYPDGSSNIFNLSTLTPGAKNDAQSPKLNKWINPSKNNTNINAVVNITVNVTDDTTQVNSTIINFNGTNFSMIKNDAIWYFLWNTSLNIQKLYNITIFFNDSYGKSDSDKLFNITVNRAPLLDAIPNKTAIKNVNLSFNITAVDLDGDTLTFSSNRSGIAISKINNSLATAFWKPTNLDLGSNIINFTVSDGSLADSKIAVINVSSINNSAPNITSVPKTTAVVNEKYIYDVDAIDIDNDTLRFSLMTNASGMSIDTLNGIITFTPTSFGFFIANVSVTDFVDITNQSYNITVKEGSKLKIIDVDVKINGKKSSTLVNNTKISKEAEPESNIEFKVTVKNDFSKGDLEIKDTEVKVTIEEIDNGDDLEEESSEFDLDAQDDKTVTLKFELPLNADEGTFDVIIEAEGEDENGTAHKQHFQIELEVEKEKHDLRFLSFDLSPTKVNCNRIINVDYKIINIGNEDEDNAILEVKNNDLDLNLIQNFSIDSGTEDNTFSNSIKLKISNGIENGIYPITANIYSDDGKVFDTKTIEIKVDECIKSGEAKETEAVLMTKSLDKAVKTQTLKEPIQIPPIRISFQEDDKMLLLMFSSALFAAFFVITAIILFVRFY